MAEEMLLSVEFSVCATFRILWGLSFPEIVLYEEGVLT